MCSRPLQIVAFGGFTSLSCSGRQRSVMPVQSCCFAHKTNCLYVIVVVVVASVLSDYLVYGNIIFFPFCYSFILKSTHIPAPALKKRTTRLLHPHPLKKKSQTASLMIASYTSTLSTFLTFVGKRFVFVEIFIKVM